MSHVGMKVSMGAHGEQKGANGSKRVTHLGYCKCSASWCGWHRRSHASRIPPRSHATAWCPPQRSRTRSQPSHTTGCWNSHRGLFSPPVSFFSLLQLRVAAFGFVPQRERLSHCRTHFAWRIGGAGTVQVPRYRRPLDTLIEHFLVSPRLTFLLIIESPG